MSALYNFLNSKTMQRFRRRAGLSTGVYLKLKRMTASPSEDLRMVKILQNFGIDKVLDVGANTGQFAEALFDFGYKGKVVSFEPTSDAYAQIQKRVAKYPQWSLADRMAIGDIDGTVEINISRDTNFNSIKDLDADYVDYNNQSEVIAQETVRISRIDSLQGEYFDSSESIMLKVDTQGFEKEVLAGAQESLKYIKGIKIEIPIQPVYQNVNLRVLEMFNYMDERGYVCVSLSEIGVNHDTGIVQEVDGIFVRKELMD